MGNPSTAGSAATNMRSSNELDSCISNKNNNISPVTKESTSSPNNTINTTSSTVYQTATSLSNSGSIPHHKVAMTDLATSSKSEVNIGVNMMRPETSVPQQNFIPSPLQATHQESMPPIYVYSHPQPFRNNPAAPLPPKTYTSAVLPLRRPIYQNIYNASGFPMDPNFGGQPHYYPAHVYRSQIVPANNNGMIPTQYTEGARYSQPLFEFQPQSTTPNSKNEELNIQFTSLIKGALGETTKSFSTQPKTQIMDKTNEVKIKPSDVQGQVNELRDLFKGIVHLDQPSSNEVKVDEANQSAKPSSTTKSSNNATPRTSVNQASIDLSVIIKNAAHGESPSVVTCEYGQEIDGFKTYSIDEMINIRSKLTYDVQKMVQTLSKFRIAIRSKYSNKSDKHWKTIAEKKQLGLVTDKEVFNHSLMLILNKITAVNFYQNWASFRSLKFTSAELVQLYAELLYDKVIGEHSWSYVYSELVRISINTFNQMHADEGYADVFVATLMDCIEKGLSRNYAEEQIIRDLKKSTSKDMEAIDKIIAETAERETAYRKRLFGVVLFVGNLFYDDVIKQERIDEIVQRLKKENDSLGVELYVCLLENVCVKYVENNNRAMITTMCKSIDTLNDYVSSHSKELTSKARFAMMDLFKYKQDKFKTLPPRKKVPKPNESSNIRSTTSGVSSISPSSINTAATGFGSHDSLRRVSHADSNSFSRMDRSSNRMSNLNRGREPSRFKSDVSDLRRPNPDAFHNPNKGKGYNKPRGAGSSMGSSFHSARYACMEKGISVSLDEDNTAFPTSASSLTSRTPKDSKPISFLKRQSSASDKITVTSNYKVTDENTTANTASSVVSSATAVAIKSSNNETVTAVGNVARSASNVQVSSDRSASIDQPKRLLSQETSSFDTEEVKESELKNLEETAQTLISNFHQNETNVSRFIIELSSYSLSDRMDILLKEAFKYYSSVSHGHYAFGMLLSEMMGRHPELVKVVKDNLSEQLIELPLNALDEPVLWDYFYLTVLPLLSNVRITLDDLHELLAKTPDVTDADGTILNMFVLGEKRLSKYDVAKMVAKQTDTAVWKRLTNFSSSSQSDIVKTISEKLPKISPFNSDCLLHWVDILLDVNYDALYVNHLFDLFYATPDEGLKDVAKCLYLYSSIGDNFTNDLITIFNRRNKLFMDELFGADSSRTLLCYLAEIFAMFKFTPNGVIVDIGVPLYKNNHVDKEWLNSWRQQDDKPYDSSKVDPDIYKIIKSRSD